MVTGSVVKEKVVSAFSSVKSDMKSLREQQEELESSINEGREHLKDYFDKRLDENFKLFEKQKQNQVRTEEELLEIRDSLGRYEKQFNDRLNESKEYLKEYFDEKINENSKMLLEQKQSQEKTKKDFLKVGDDLGVYEKKLGEMSDSITDIIHLLDFKVEEEEYARPGFFRRLIFRRNKNKMYINFLKNQQEKLKSKIGESREYLKSYFNEKLGENSKMLFEQRRSQENKINENYKVLLEQRRNYEGMINGNSKLLAEQRQDYESKINENSKMLLEQRQDYESKINENSKILLEQGRGYEEMKSKVEEISKIKSDLEVYRRQFNSINTSIEDMKQRLARQEEQLLDSGAGEQRQESQPKIGFFRRLMGRGSDSNMRLLRRRQKKLEAKVVESRKYLRGYFDEKMSEKSKILEDLEEQAQEYESKINRNSESIEEQRRDYGRAERDIRRIKDDLESYGEQFNSINTSIEDMKQKLAQQEQQLNSLSDSEIEEGGEEVPPKLGFFKRLMGRNRKSEEVELEHLKDEVEIDEERSEKV